MRYTCMAAMLLTLALVSGCAAGGKAAGRSATSAAAPETAQASAAALASITSRGADAAGGPAPEPRQYKDVEKIVPAYDPAPLIRPTVNLSIYHISVPFGTVCGNENLWKRVDEQALDIGSYDVLFKNGIRVGRVPFSEFDYFQRILNQGPVEHRPATFAASGAKLIEVMLKREIPSQVICDFDRRNIATIASYDDSSNVIRVEFEPVPRKAGDIRISLVPMVRLARKRLVPIGDTETREIPYLNPEKYYDLNLRAEVPLDSFLIVGCSPEARSAMSLGHNFLTREGKTERLEEVLLLVPRALGATDPTPAGNTAIAAPPQEQGGPRGDEQ